MRYIDAATIERLFDLDTAYRSQMEAFRCLGTGVAELAERLILNASPHDALAFCYASRLRPGAPAVCKFGAVADNRARGLPSVHAVVIALDATTGAPLACFDGEPITTLRTPAATAVAVDHLARTGEHELAVIGCGLQGRSHVRALAGRVSRVHLWDHHPGRAAELADKLAGEVGVPLLVATSPAAAVRAADIVVTCTTSVTPVLAGAWVAPGTTVVSIGSFAPDRCEVDAALVRRADTIVVDHAGIARRQAGPLVAGLDAGDIAPESVVDLGDVVAGRRPARRDDNGIVYYNSVGLGVQDAAAVTALLDLLTT